MEAWTNSSTGTLESRPEGAPSAASAAAEVTPEPHPAALDASTAATPPPEAAVPTPLPTMVSGEIASPLPLVTVIPPPAAPPAPSVLVAPPAANAVTAPVRPQAHAGDDPGFADQIINNWMKQGDRLADPRPVEDLDLVDLAEPTDPVAHELLDSSRQSRQSVGPIARTGRAARWLSIGALGVAMSLGLYWAAQEPRPGAGYAAAAPAPANVVETPPAPQPPAPAATPELAAVQVAQSASSAARGKHKHRRAAAAATGAGRAHHRHGR